MKAVDPVTATAALLCFDLQVSVSEGAAKTAEGHISRTEAWRNSLITVTCDESVLNLHCQK